MNFLKNTITLAVEIVCLILFILWYANSKDIEPLIGLIASSGSLIISLILITIDKKPTIEFSRVNSRPSRKNLGYSQNKPINSGNTIKVGSGQSIPILCWEMSKVFNIHIKNNSEIPAYNIEIGILNQSPKITVNSNLKPLASLSHNEHITFDLIFSELFEGTYSEADNYVKNIDKDEELEKLQVYLAYSNSKKRKRYLIYHWRDGSVEEKKSLRT